MNLLITRKLKEYREVLADLLDTESCSWDHNHSCQTHGYFYLDQGEMCPQERAKRLLEADGYVL